MFNKPRYRLQKTVPNQVIQVWPVQNEHNPYNLIFTTKFNDSSILITIIAWDYLNLSLANEYVTNPGNQVWQMLLQADQPIRLQYWHHI